MADKSDKRDIIADQRKEQIQKAALKVFSEKGFGKATIPDIAREAGIAVGTIYLYFQTKQEILLSILESHVLIDPLMGYLEKAKEVSDQELLSALFEACLKFGFENINQFLFLLSEILRDPYIKKLYAKQALRPALKLIEDYLQSRKEAGAFNASIDMKIASRALVGMVMGLVLLFGVERGHGGSMKDWNRLAEEFAHLILKGLERDAGDGYEVSGLMDINNGGVA